MDRVVDVASPAGAPSSSGLPAIDEVVSHVGALAGRPVSEHVAVYESANRELRGALDAHVRPAAPV